MSLSNGLSQAGTPPTSLSVSAEVTLGKNDAAVAQKLKLSAQNPGCRPGRLQNYGRAAGSAEARLA